MSSNPLFDMITSQLSQGDALQQVGSLLGNADATTSRNATGAAVSTILGALSRNAAKPEGAEALFGALTRDHDGGILDDVAGYLGKGDSSPGAAILKHVLGAKQAGVQQGLGAATGIDASQAGKLLAMVAPLVLGALAKQKSAQGLDAGALAGMLGQERAGLAKNPSLGGGVLGSLLDTDGDGDFDAKDALKHGAGLLGKLFGR